MSALKWKILFHIIMILIIFGGGFFTGRSTIKTKEIHKTEYIKGDTVRDTIYQPKPYKVVEPVDTLNIIKDCIEKGIYQELWPEKVITEYIEITKEDSTKIVEDWSKKRMYNEILFQNDSIGTCNIKTEVQYNRIQNMDYIFVPINKTVTEKKQFVKTFSPFIGAGYLTKPRAEIPSSMLTVSGGFFIKEKYGLQLQFLHGLNNDEDYLGGSLLIKF